MPTADQFQESLLIKILYLGDSGTGKTSSLVSLLELGYNLKVIDFDKGLLNLIMHARKRCPERLGQIEYETFQDDYKATQTGLILAGQPKAFPNALKKLTEWQSLDDPMTVVILDSLSMAGRAAYAWAFGMNPLLQKNKQAIYGAAQDAIEDTISVLTSDNFKTNVIVITHIKYDEMDGLNKGFPNSIGKALGPKIPRYFNLMIQAETQGSGNAVKRKIKTVPTGIIDLKTPPLDIPSELPLDSGLATLFTKLKEKN